MAETNQNYREHGTALILKNTLMFLRLATSSKTEQICSTSPLPILLAHSGSLKS
ncbi:hypothetical protein JL09_g5422 [Pichia kudriavzevii]|uniref:Uncharacterized protein n=1 Tax=Pichia kudriavzevii TaxID=4909 RepID=A0A099NRQ4_PICKU|nr:hypothetical protein JL09_g5422 [Pichia kudriavzevii]